MEEIERRLGLGGGTPCDKPNAPVWSFGRWAGRALGQLFPEMTIVAIVDSSAVVFRGYSPCS